MILMDEEVGTLSSRVFVYATLATVAASLALAFAFGAAWWFATREADGLRAAAIEARLSEQTCRIAVERLDARLDQYEEWVVAAGPRKRTSDSAGMGGE